VKGLALGPLDQCELTPAGVAGDREFFLVDENDRPVNGKGLGALQQVVPRYDGADGSLTLAFPDGRVISQSIQLGASLDARFWQTTVRVRLVEGRWSGAISDFVGRNPRLVRAPAPAADRLPSGAATLHGTGSLRAIARILGVDAVELL
jgi:uncharacterized protein YcbX